MPRKEVARSMIQSREWLRDEGQPDHVRRYEDAFVIVLSSTAAGSFRSLRFLNPTGCPSERSATPVALPFECS